MSWKLPREQCRLRREGPPGVPGLVEKPIGLRQLGCDASYSGLAEVPNRCPGYQRNGLASRRRAQDQSPGQFGRGFG